MTRIFFVLCLINLFFSDATHANDKKDSIIKTPLVIAEKITMYSEVFKIDRDFYVSLPANYSLVSKKYPILFVLDGDHFIRMADLASKDLSSSHQSEEMIIVAIAQKDRRSELREPGAIQFFNYINSELVPYIKQNYRTTDFHSIYGHSLGGSFVLDIMLRNDRLFNNYFAVSPVIDMEGTPKINDLKRYFSQKTNQKKYFYLAKGNEKDQYQKTIPVVAKMINENQPDWLRFTHQQFPDKSHATVALPTMFASISELYQGWILPEMGNLNAFNSIEQVKAIGGYKKVKEYYQNYSLKLGFEFSVPSIVYSRFAWIYHNAKDHESLLNLIRQEGKDREEVNYYLGQSYLYGKNYENAVSLMQEDVKLNPNHIRGWYTLSLAHREINQMDEAKSALLKAIELAKVNNSEHLNKYEKMLHTLH